VSETSRESPVPAFADASARRSVLHGMSVAAELAADARASELPALLTDASCLPRLGVKGPNAQAWLESQGLQLPAANCWHYDAGLRIARLGRSEYLLEAASQLARLSQLAAALAPAPGLYPVLRQDAAIWLAGPAAARILRQLATYDFTTLAAEDATVLLTLLGGVSATVLWEAAAADRCYAIYFDASYGSYLWTTLLSLVVAERGAAVSFYVLAPATLRSSADADDPNTNPVSES
jgi:sarcosine oxidase subunit gamma